MQKITHTLALIAVLVLTFPIGFLTIPIFFIICNQIISKKYDVDFAFRLVHTMLEKRIELIPDMLNSIPEIKIYDSELFDAIARISKNIQENELPLANRIEQEGKLTALLDYLANRIKNHSDLEYNANMQYLNRVLSHVAEQIEEAREKYNIAAITFNTSFSFYPYKVISLAMAYTPIPCFDSQEVKIPKIDALRLAA